MEGFHFALGERRVRAFFILFHLTTSVSYVHKYIVYTVNGESFTGLNFHGFDPMKYFAEILLQFIGRECSQL